MDQKMALGDNMLSLKTVSEASKEIANTVKQSRLSRKLTQEGLAERAGVNLATYRRFERTGKISLEGYLKLMNALGLMEEVISITNSRNQQFQNIHEVVKAQNTARTPKKGTRK